MTEVELHAEISEYRDEYAIEKALEIATYHEKLQWMLPDKVQQ